MPASALNATIEAARAGEHGKGFAVVASAIAAAVEEQSVAIREISRVAQDVAVGTERASTGVASVSEAVAETGQAVAGVRGASAEVARQGERLQGGVASVVRRLREQGAAA